jgi:ufm1-conjugating enzyme 1
MMSSIEEAASKIPLLTIHAGPKDEKWKDRLKEELKAIITYVKSNKLQDNDWFKIEPSKDGTKWQGVCSCTHNLVRYEFRLQF